MMGDRLRTASSSEDLLKIEDEVNGTLFDFALFMCSTNPRVKYVDVVIVVQSEKDSH